jgi:hypothetical protein
VGDDAAKGRVADRANASIKLRSKLMADVRQNAHADMFQGASVGK